MKATNKFIVKRKVTYAGLYEVDAINFVEYCHVCGLSIDKDAAQGYWRASTKRFNFCKKCNRKVHGAPDQIETDTRNGYVFPYADYNNPLSCEKAANLCAECAGYLDD